MDDILQAVKAQCSITGAKHLNYSIFTLVLQKCLTVITPVGLNTNSNSYTGSDTYISLG